MAPGNDTAARTTLAGSEFSLLSLIWALNISEGFRSSGVGVEG